MIKGLEQYNQLLLEDSHNPELTTKLSSSGLWIANLLMQGMSGVGVNEDEASNDVLKEFKQTLNESIST